MVVLGVVGFDLIAMRKERDNMKKEKVLSVRNKKEVKGEMTICMLGWLRCISCFVKKNVITLEYLIEKEN